jgi:hypothetical protein
MRQSRETSDFGLSHGKVELVVTVMGKTGARQRVRFNPFCVTVMKYLRPSDFIRKRGFFWLIVLEVQD